NPHLEALLSKKLRVETAEYKKAWSQILDDEGSVQNLECLDEWEKQVFKTAYEVDQRAIIELAGDRQEYICQSQSLNLYFPSGSSRAYINKVHRLAYKRGLKTLYYLRSTPIRTAGKVSYDTEKECTSCQG